MSLIQLLLSGLFGLLLNVFSLNEVISVCLVFTGMFSTSAWCLGVLYVAVHGCSLPTYSWISNRLNGTMMQISGAFSHLFFFLLLLSAINPSHLTPMSADLCPFLSQWLYCWLGCLFLSSLQLENASRNRVGQMLVCLFSSLGSSCKLPASNV